MIILFSLFVVQKISDRTIQGWGEFKEMSNNSHVYHTQNFKAFKELFVSVVSLLNPNGSEEMYGQAADNLIALETSLAQVRDGIDLWVLLNIH